VQYGRLKVSPRYLECARNITNLPDIFNVPNVLSSARKWGICQISAYIKVITKLTVIPNCNTSGTQL
jgi:hypothetical protein